MVQNVEVTCRNCKTISINDEEFCPKCHFRLRSARFGRNTQSGGKTFSKKNEIENIQNGLGSNMGEINQTSIKSGMNYQTYLENQLYDLHQAFRIEQNFKNGSSPEAVKWLDTSEYKEQKQREAKITSLYIQQNPAIYPPVLDYDRISSMGSNDERRNQMELQLIEIAQKLKQIEIEKLSDSDVENYNSQIIDLFNKVINSDLIPIIQKIDPHILQPKNMRIVQQVLRKTMINGTNFNQLKKLSKEKQLDALFGPSGSSEGGLARTNPQEKELFREHFKNDPMHMIGKEFEPFGPFAWKYGIFRAMTQLKAYESVTWKGGGKTFKLFQEKDYAKPSNFNNKYNLLNLVKDLGPLLVVRFPELVETGITMIGFFIELASRTVNVQAPKDQYLLFESYNIFGS